MRVLIVSKPLVPPWDDAGRNIPRDVVSGCDGIGFEVMTDGRDPFRDPRVRILPLYPDAGRYRAGPRQNLPVLRHLLTGRLPPLIHYFFAPNLPSSAAGRLLRLRGGRSIHTLCSAPPETARPERLLFADITVALSRYTFNRLRQAGIGNIVMIPPGVAQPDRLGLPAGSRSADRLLHVVYAGDFGRSGAVRHLPALIDEVGRPGAAVRLTIACRRKQPSDGAVEEGLEARARTRAAGRVAFAGRVDDMPALLAAADLMVMPVDSLHGKADFPLVLLEAMAGGSAAAGFPVGPLAELFDYHPDAAIAPGDTLALVRLVRELSLTPARVAEMGAAAERAVRTRFPLRAQADAYTALYRSLAGGGR